MSDGVLIAIIVCVTVVLLVLVMVGYLVFAGRQAPGTSDPWHNIPRGSFTPDPDAPDPVRVAEAALGRAALDEESEKIIEQPIPFDPEHPPYWMVYNPRPGVERRSCHCHDDPLGDGQEVLWWSLPDVPDPEIPNGRVLLFCRRSVPAGQA